MTDIASRIRNAHGPTMLLDDDVTHGWNDVLTRIDTPLQRTAARRHRRVSRRVLIAVVVAVVSLASVALAQDRDLREAVGLTDAERSAERMDVFEQPATGVAGLSEMTRSLLGTTRDAPYADRYGIDPTALHHVMTYRFGKYVVHMWVAPARGGQACLFEEVVGRSGGLSCSYGMKFNGHVTVGYGGDIRMGTIVNGLADDAVTQVRVALSDGTVRIARLQRNAYLLHIADPHVRPRGLEVDLKDGRTLDIEMNGCLHGQLERSTSRLGCGYGMNRGPADVRLH